MLYVPGQNAPSCGVEQARTPIISNCSASSDVKAQDEAFCLHMPLLQVCMHVVTSSLQVCCRCRPYICMQRNGDHCSSFQGPVYTFASRTKHMHGYLTSTNQELTIAHSILHQPSKMSSDSLLCRIFPIQISKLIRPLARDAATLHCNRNMRATYKI